MGTLLGFLTGNGALKPVFDGIEGIIGKFITDPTQKLQASIAAAQLQADTTTKLATLDEAWAQAQSNVIIAEAKSESWLTRNWRPIVALFFTANVGIIIWTGGYINGREIDHAFVMELFGTVKICLGGYFMGRSAEKTLPQTAGKIAEIFANKTK